MASVSNRCGANGAPKGAQCAGRPGRARESTSRSSLTNIVGGFHAIVGRSVMATQDSQTPREGSIPSRPAARDRDDRPTGRHSPRTGDIGVRIPVVPPTLSGLPSRLRRRGTCMVSRTERVRLPSTALPVSRTDNRIRARGHRPKAGPLASNQPISVRLRLPAPLSMPWVSQCGEGMRWSSNGRIRERHSRGAGSIPVHRSITSTRITSLFSSRASGEGCGLQHRKDEFDSRPALSAFIPFAPVARLDVHATSTRAD